MLVQVYIVTNASPSLYIISTNNFITYKFSLIFQLVCYSGIHGGGGGGGGNIHDFFLEITPCSAVPHPI